MNYEQKYAKALWQMKELYNRVKYLSSTEALLVSQTLENTFPELKESEDERIRKEIIQSIQDNMCVIHKDKCIAWLEKQKEENFIDKSLVKEEAHRIAWECSKHYDPLLSKESWCEMAALDMAYWFEKQGEQKPAWSEEDEQMFNSIIEVLEVTPSARFIPIKREIMIPWLKSLKNRVIPQQKQEWSEEDESHIGRILSYLESFKAYNAPHIEPIKKEIDWLKSLKPNHWKPSEEQMKSLKYFIDFHRPQANASTEGWKEFKYLESLYNDLKTLNYGKI